MTTNDNIQKYTIYCPHEDVHIEVDKTLHNAYYDGCSELRRNKRKRGECACKEEEYYKCDMNCAECKFRRGECGAVDWIRGKKEVCNMDDYKEVAAEGDMVADVERKDCYAHLQRTIAMLTDYEKDIVSKVMNGSSLSKIAEEKSVAKTTLHYQWKKICEKLRRQLEGYR